MLNRLPLRVACAVIKDADGRLLAALRPQGRSLGGKWEFPGGKIEAHESPTLALIRELQEELNIVAEPILSLPVVRHDYPDFTIELHPIIMRILSGIPHPHEHAELRWVSMTEALTLDWAEADLPVLMELENVAAPPSLARFSE